MGGFRLLRRFTEKFSVKIFTLFTFFIVITSITFATFFIHFVSQYQKDKLISEGKILSNLLAYNSRIGVFSENTALLRDAVDGVLKQKGVLEASVFSTQGKLLHRHGRKIEKGEEHQRREGKNPEEIAKRLKQFSHPFQLEYDDRLEFWAPVISNSSYSTEESLFFQRESSQRKGDLIGFVGLKLDKAILKKRVKDLLYNSILITALFLLLGALVTFFVAHGITRPLIKLTEGVKAIGRGGNVEKILVETEDEVGKLAIAFNNMSEALEKRESEKNQLQKQLNHAQKMEAIGTLAGGIAHDFNNILTAIMGYGNLLQMEISKANPLREHVDLILDSAERAANLIRSLLTFSREQKINFDPINLNTNIKNIKKILYRLIHDNIEIKLKLAKEDLIVMADSGQIDHILFNFATNAKDAMPDGGVFTISTKSVKMNENFFVSDHTPKPGTASRYALLKVEDTGVGIDSKTLERIFDPFFTTKEVGKGTGLGLSMVYGIIKQHNGFIDVDSQPGKGTRFSIYLPLIELKMRPKTEKPLFMSERGTETLLIAEDDEPVKKLSTEIFRQYGYKVIEAINGEDAVKKFMENMEKIQCLLFDVIMPKKNGKEAYEEIKKIKPNIKALFMSGYEHSVINRTGIFDRGGIDVISKPVSPQILLRKVRDLLDT